jgi:hypothetical protein
MSFLLNLINRSLQSKSSSIISSYVSKEAAVRHFAEESRFTQKRTNYGPYLVFFGILTGAGALGNYYYKRFKHPDSPEEADAKADEMPVMERVKHGVLHAGASLLQVIYSIQYFNLKRK